jgi:ribosome-binding factor A
MNSNKIERVQSLIRRNLSEIIQMEVKDPHLGFVSIPEVKVTSDFSYAKIYVSFIIESQAEEGMEVLEHSKGYIRSQLAKRMDTKRIPELIFIKDDSYEKAQHLEELLKK